MTMQSSQIWSGTMAGAFSPINSPACKSCFQRPDYSLVGSTGTLIDRVAAHNAVRVTNLPGARAPAAVGGAPHFTSYDTEDQTLVAPALALDGLAGADGTADHHFAIMIASDAFSGADGFYLAADQSGWFVILLYPVDGNATAQFLIWDSVLNDYRRTIVTIGPFAGIPGTPLKIQAKKLANRPYVRVNGGAWVQGPVSGALGISNYEPLVLGSMNGTIYGFAAWQGAQTDAYADQVDAWGALLFP